MTGVTERARRNLAGAEPFPPELWADTVYSRRAIPATLAAGHPAPGQTDVAEPDAYPEGRRLALAPPPLHLAPSPGPAPAGLADPAVLAALLHYAYGLLQHDLTPHGWPLHRAVASARCQYPSQLTLVAPTTAYRFDPLHHQLVCLDAEMGGGSAAEPSGCGGPAASRFAVITSQFARTARLYGDYAPRLCAQEAGMLLGAVHLVASALGLRTRPGQDRDTLDGLCAGRLPADEHPMGYLEILPPAERPPAGAPRVPAGLAAVLRARHSGAAIFDPVPAPAPRALLTDLGADLAAAPFADFSCHLLVQRVADSAPGHYVHSDGRLWQVRDGDPLALLERIGQTEGRVSMNFRSTACTAYIAVRRGSAVAAYGADAFRRLHLAAGAAAHLLCVAAARHGLSARVHNGYDAARAERLLGLAPDETVVFQVAIGAARPGAAFRLPVVF
ncbi:nitroreductase family protein [Streptomyces sp. NBC_00083]|uniref:nitroreductase family protein n=1 Tax=Streptomyces sp. NBC_00083 TaxID=2975647 RepID=UPI00224FF155|nr:nitroreductase family protein [Streptomyces sp. NBC_00083]MCX5384501.1 nitroreductase family protein [Streptomyces sp. NBC_00083]